MTYCLTLDPDADQYVKCTFGENHYTIIDQVQRLAGKLSTLFASLNSQPAGGSVNSNKTDQRYIGSHKGIDGGVTDTGRIIRGAWT